MKQRHSRMPYKLLDLAISNHAKCVYMALMHFRSKTRPSIKVSLAKVAEVTGLKGRQLTNHINTLLQYNIIARRKNQHGNGEYSCNVYTITCDETYFAEIPWEIAYDNTLSANAKLGYCIMKRYTDLGKRDYACYMTKRELTEKIGCSSNEVDKIKRNLKMAGFIEYERSSNKITLIYEKALEEKINSEIKRVVRNKNEVSQYENHSTSI